MNYRVVFESKPEQGQIFRGSRSYRTADKAIKEAQRLAEEQGWNVSAMKLTPAGNLDSIIWTTRNQ